MDIRKWRRPIYLTISEIRHKYEDLVILLKLNKEFLGRCVQVGLIDGDPPKNNKPTLIEEHSFREFVKMLVEIKKNRLPDITDI